MSSEWSTADRVAGLGSLTLASAATVAFNVGKPINVKRVTLVYTTAQATAVSAITFGVRNADGTTGVVNKGTFNAPIAAVNSVIDAEVAGTYPNPIVNTGEVSQNVANVPNYVVGYQTNLPGVIQVNPGQQFFVTSGGTGSAGVAQVFIEYTEQGSNKLRFSPIYAAVTLN